MEHKKKFKNKIKNKIKLYHYKFHGSLSDNNNYVENIYFIGLYKIDTNVIHPLVLFEH